MDSKLMAQIGVGACFILAVIGSIAGTYIVGSTVVGAWKKCYLQNKPAPFILVAFAGAPITNAIYGFILMNQMAIGKNLDSFEKLYMGVFAGAALMASAYTQARIAAHAAEAYAETGQGFGNYMMVIGICETVALFVMVFTMLFAL
ncbi:MAG: V-type ATP synthase subunit K [Treponema sp.]|nr:V-type ATP synthase subunit K [Treponema sp.]